MAYKSNARKEDEEVDEGFEDLSSSALHDIHYGHINQGFEEETSRSRTDDEFNPVRQKTNNRDVIFDDHGQCSIYAYSDAIATSVYLLRLAEVSSHFVNSTT